MNKIRYTFRQIFIAALVTVLLGMAPAPVFAQDGPVQTPANGVSGPTGSAAGTYHYDETTGLWENDHYIYNPATYQTTPKAALEYTYNPATGMWDTYVWEYSAAQGQYLQSLVSVTVPPAGAITHGGPEPVVEETLTNPVTGSNESSPSAQNSSLAELPGGTTADQHQETGAALNTNTGVNMTNAINSTAGTGNSLALANTTAGNVSSGNAAAMANVVNLLQSQSSLGNMGGNGFATFTANIQGNVSGDFLIDPAAFAQPANLGSQNLANYKLTDKTEGTILNNIDLNASSGNAAAAQNTTVGNVTSGDANAIANVVNMINSVVAANQSFMGVINIYGDYSGNILVPTDSLNALLGSTGPGSSTTIGQTANASNTVNANSEQNIANNINLAAVSGTASASENTKAGNVTSGNGLTNLTILNLTGRQVVAANSLLVFVNVLGSWVGLIMDAPAGSTAAAYGGGVIADNSLAVNGDINSTEKFGITNNINARAATGNASGTQNTSVGDIRSGNATASANVANLIGSNLSLSNWFGVLFINVFGTWKGNFGTAKPPAVPPITSGPAVADMGGGGFGAAFNDAKVFAFTPTTSSGGTKLGLSPLSEANSNSSMTSSDMVEKVSKVLASSVTGSDTGRPGVAQQSTAGNDFEWSAVMVAIGLAGLGLVGVERVRSNLRARQLRR